MRKISIILVFIAVTAPVFSQSKNHKLGITFGGGSQKYRGDLGNGFTFKNNTWYGNFALNVKYYVNKSFDAGVFGTMGAFGYCQSESQKNKEVPFNERCPGCVNRLGNGNLNSRMTTFGFNANYKFANGYLLNQNSDLKPYLYVGAAFNRVTDVMKMNCIREGIYFSLNAGVGVKYYINNRINVGYNLGFGYLTQDNVDNRVNYGQDTDMYMQNSLLVGIDLF